MGSPSIRRAELAGTWYPATESACRQSFETFDLGAVGSDRKRLVAGVVPHAGWVFSGAVAYNVMREIAARASRVDTVVLFAGHLHPSSPFTVMSHGACQTPLGPLDTDDDMARHLIERTDLRGESPDAHSQDNSAEVEYPLIKHFFPDAKLLVIGASPRAEVVTLADRVVEAAQRCGRSIVAIGSTDLTHYGPNYAWTPHGTGERAERWVRETNDPLFVEAACAELPHRVLDVALQHRNACCPGAVAAAMRCAQLLGATDAETLRYATSAEVHPDASFVGYAGIVY